MKKIVLISICIVTCIAMLCGCSNTAKTEKPDNGTPVIQTTPTVEPSYELTSNSEKATMKASKDFKTVIQITNTYPGDIVCVFDDTEIATCDWAQWVGSKGSLMFTGLKKGETTLVIYAGVENKDIGTAKASVSINVIVEDDPIAE